MSGGRGWIVTVLAVIGVVVLWEIVERLVAARFPLVPAPSAIGGAIVRFATPIWLNLRLTLIESALGLAGGSVLGIGVAAVFVRWPRVERSLYNLIVTIHSIPLVAVAPILRR